MVSARTATVAVVIAALIVVASACNPEGTPRSRAVSVFGTKACQVGVVGDSLTLGARDVGGLAAKFTAAGCSVSAIDARVSRHTNEGADIVERWARAGTMPRILVVALGTNECSRGAFAPAVRRILRAAGPDRPVVWINTYRRGCDHHMNDTLFEIQRNELNQRADGGNLWIQNFYSWIHGNRGLLARDGLHLTSAGYRAHADRIVAAVTQGLG